MNAFVGKFRSLFVHEIYSTLVVNQAAILCNLLIGIVFFLMLFKEDMADKAIHYIEYAYLLVPFAWRYLSKELKLYAYFALIFVVSAAFSNLFSPFSMRDYGGKTIQHWLLILPFASVVFFSNPSLNKLFTFLTFMLLVGLYPAIHDVYTGLRRYDGFFGLPIVWGNIALLGGLMCLFLGLWSSSAILKFHGLFCFLLGMFISGVSQSRGGWLAIITLSPLILVTLKNTLPKRVFILVLVVILIGGVTIVSSPHIGIGERFAEIGTNIQRYINNAPNSNDTSEGSRFEMWRSAVRATAEYPLLGIGNSGYKNFTAQDELYRSNYKGPHPHNDILALLSCYGVIGFLLMATALYHFYMGIVRSTKAHSGDKRIFLLATILLVSFFDFGLTEVFLTYARIGSGFFIFVSTYLLVLAHKNRTNAQSAL